MSTISLSSGVRAALGSLSSVKSDAAQAQYRLSTGKKVNSAVDDPVNFFTAAGLNDRAGQLTKNLDGISNGIQTITAASQGIDSITKLVSSLQSTIKQAQADAVANRPAKAGTALSTAAETALNSKSLKDTTLDKSLADDNGATANTATAAYAGNLGIDTSTNTNLAVTISAGNTTYTAALSATGTVRDLVNEINKSGIATASVDDAGKLNVTGNGSNTLKVGIGSGTSAALAATDSAAGTLNVSAGLLVADATTGIAASGNSTVRSNLVNQFNDLTSQIDQLAKDAGFNGKNLLAGDKLSIVFNEKTGSQQSKLDVQGSTITSANLGIQQASTATVPPAGSFNIQDDSALSTASDNLTNVLTTLRSTSSSLGASLSTVQTRQDFTKNLSNTLTAGADNLVSADTNQEAANLLALQTRQQLSQTALSLSNQADQAILRLF
ncbi:Flagellin FlgL [Bosea sp. OK403]|uniref:flagellin N-terminal helical domain-containing protein n=1 Tax=Bosea sp. OK403 TaxID=1855286 RepID=UPI0008EEEA20|nr:flagellin [Bosea sp. OK403]SFJ25733.1 Flagellin FlgL [Bosea sp. OK403]